ncbi:MAG: phosphatidate cytidylyltransferase [Deltaproteobacteria bacterium]|nr:phosphatidate cytidylyltransferase [Deltaproteobacteria bacterium]
MGDLKKRVVTAVVIGPIIISLFYVLPLFPFFLFIFLVGVLAALESTKISTPKMRAAILTFSVFSFFFLYFKRYESFLLWILFSNCIFIIFAVLEKKASYSPFEILKTVVINLFIILFVIFPLYSIYALKELKEIYPLVLLFTVWTSDILAYFVGKTFGRMKLCPAISPGKTFEGLGGAVMGSTAVFLVLSRTTGFELISATVVGIFLGLLGQIGDLFESIIKRFLGIKDSSEIFPGHGGILDRMDSFIFTAPFLYKILSLRS